MQGLELSRCFFDDYGRDLLASFPEVEGLLACGLVGEGSECFGYDDALSQDHDFEPGFCIFLPNEDKVDRSIAFKLERAYAALPKEYQGFQRLDLDPVGGSRHGVIRFSDFLQAHIGSATGELSLGQWFSLPGFRLANVTNGQIWHDPSGFVTRVRENLLHMPEDVRLKKMAGHAALMDQSGYYNYHRCLEHGETAAARLAMNRFVENCLSLCFLIERRYPPFYKWVFRGLRDLPHLSSLSPALEVLLEDDKDEDALKRVTNAILDALEMPSGSNLTQAALSLNQQIEDGTIRNLDLLAAVE